MKETLKIVVRDRFPWRLGETDLRRVVSLRDGVLEYNGEELGQPTGILRVYRSPATIANVANAMIGCPVTDGHVDQDHLIPQAVILGEVREAKAIDLDDPNTKARLAVENLVEVQEGCSDRWQMYRDEGREFSLGYGATLVPAPDGVDYDYEQREIEPHHLAVVPAGRCGPACTFLDARPETEAASAAPQKEEEMKVPKFFADAAGEYSIQKIMEIVAALPEALKTVPMAQLQKAAPQLEALIAAAKVGLPEAPRAEEAPAPEAAPAGSDAAPDACGTGPGKEMPKPGDKAADAKRLADAVSEAVAAHTETIERARLFVDEQYKFSGKTTTQIMRDVLAQERPGLSFADAELAMAFKLLEAKPRPKADPYARFGDQGVHPVDKWFDEGRKPATNKEN